MIVVPWISNFFGAVLLAGMMYGGQSFKGKELFLIEWP
jgi:hypothetical protein